jgi:hypothetical protein
MCKKKPQRALSEAKLSRGRSRISLPGKRLKPLLAVWMSLGSSLLQLNSWIEALKAASPWPVTDLI